LRYQLEGLKNEKAFFSIEGGQGCLLILPMTAGWLNFTAAVPDYE